MEYLILPQSMGDNPNTDFECKENSEHLVDNHQLIVGLTFWISQWTVESKNHTVQDNQNEDEVFEA